MSYNLKKKSLPRKLMVGFMASLLITAVLWWLANMVGWIDRLISSDALTVSSLLFIAWYAFHLGVLRIRKMAAIRDYEAEVQERVVNYLTETAKPCAKRIAHVLTGGFFLPDEKHSQICQLMTDIGEVKATDPQNDVNLDAHLMVYREQMDIGLGDVDAVREDLTGLGMMGTLVGMMLAMRGLNVHDMGDPSKLAEILGFMVTNAGIAMSTTLVGGGCAILLGRMVKRVENDYHTFIAQLHRVAVVRIMPMICSPNRYREVAEAAGWNSQSAEAESN